MSEHKYETGQAYYRMGLAHQWGLILPHESDGRSSPLLIETWFYQGYFRLDWGTTDCDVPNHFHVFQPFVPLERTLDREPEQGLKIPSLRAAESSMLSLDELMRELAKMKRGKD